jgi:hypothetical protein
MNRKSKSIIESLFISREFDSLFAKLYPSEFIEDLKMEVVLILCEFPDDKLLKIYNDGSLVHYVKKIIHYSISENGAIRKKYQLKKVSSLSPLLTPDEYAERSAQERLEEAVFNFYPLLHWRDVAIINLYLKHGTFRSAAKEVGVPYSTLFKMFNETKKIIIATALKDETLMPLFKKHKKRKVFYNNYNKLIFKANGGATLCE